MDPFSNTLGSGRYQMSFPLLLRPLFHAVPSPLLSYPSSMQRLDCTSAYPRSNLAESTHPSSPALTLQGTSQNSINTVCPGDVFSNQVTKNSFPVLSLRASVSSTISLASDYDMANSDNASLASLNNEFVHPTLRLPCSMDPYGSRIPTSSGSSFYEPLQSFLGEGYSATASATASAPGWNPNSVAEYDTHTMSPSKSLGQINSFANLANSTSSSYDHKSYLKNKRGAQQAIEKNAKRTKSMPILMDGHSTPSRSFMDVDAKPNYYPGYPFGGQFQSAYDSVDGFTGQSLQALNSDNDVDLASPVEFQMPHDADNNADISMHGHQHAASLEYSGVFDYNVEKHKSPNMQKLDFSVGASNSSVQNSSSYIIAAASHHRSVSSCSSSSNQSSHVSSASSFSSTAPLFSPVTANALPPRALGSPFSPPEKDPVKLVEFLRKTEIDDTRFEAILNHPKASKMDFQETKEGLMQFGNIYYQDKYPAPKKGFFPEQHNIFLKMKIVCTLVELQKTEEKKKRAAAKEPFYKKVLSKFPVLENSEGMFVQVRSSCGKEFISSKSEEVNKTAIDGVLQKLQAENFDIRLLENMAEFETFRALLGDDHAKDCDEKYVKRPLNSYMLYRSSMIKVAVVLTILQLTNELTVHYYERFIKPFIKGHTVVFSERILLKLIEEDLKIIMNSESPTSPESIRKVNSALDQLFRESGISTGSSQFQKVYTSSMSTDARLSKLRNFSIMKSYRSVKINHGAICHVITLLWLTESEEVKAKFSKYSQLEKQIHEETYPHYKYNPKKKKKTGDEDQRSSSGKAKEATKPKARELRKAKSVASLGASTRSRKRSRQ